MVLMGKCHSSFQSQAVPMKFLFLFLVAVNKNAKREIFCIMNSWKLLFNGKEQLTILEKWTGKQNVEGRSKRT